MHPPPAMPPPTGLMPGIFAAVTPSEPPSIEWIGNAQHVAKAGYIQVALIIFGLLWTLFVTTTDRYSKRAARDHHNGLPASKEVSIAYELGSQLARGAALALIIVGATQTDGQWTNVALLGYIFLLGLVRVAIRPSSPAWRKFILLQINLLLFGAFVIFLLGEILPQLPTRLPYRPNRMVVGAIISLSVAIFIAFITPRVWIPPSVELDIHPRAPQPVPSFEETCSPFNYYFTYEWLTPLIWKGSRSSVEMADLPSLPWYDEPLKLMRDIMRIREEGKLKTLWTVLTFQRTELITMAIWISLSSIADVLAPFALYQLLAYIENPDAALLNATLWLFLMFAGPMARSVCFQQYIFTSTRLIVRIKSGMTQELYNRAMVSMELEEDVLNAIESKGGKKSGMQSTSTGRLSNLMSSDVDAITWSRDFLQVLSGIPISLALSFVGLYKLLGWPSLVGTGFMLLMSPVPALVGRLMIKSQRAVKQAQDSRISLINEYLGSIKAIKYFGWEESMIKKIQEARGKEQKYLWRITVLMTIIDVVNQFIPIAGLVLIFSLYVGVLKQPLTAPVAFTTLSLVMIMNMKIDTIAYFVRNATNAWVSVERLDRYFNSTVPLVRYPAGPPRISDATFRRHKKAAFALKNISIDFVEGGLNAITGPSGSGKTTLLLSLLGETILEAGSVSKPEDVAYASQTPWLQSETIRTNILFHSEFDKIRYDRVIEACSLGPDLDELPSGDETEVGENGTSLSGGQKARVALARALYSHAPLLLLDDTFSALDTKTAAAVWKSCFCSDLLKGRTVILVTQIPWVVTQADLAITLEDGAVKSAEQNIGVVRKPVVLELEMVEDVAVDGLKPAIESDETDPKKKTTSAKPPLAASAKEDDIAKEMKVGGRSARLGFFKYMLYFGGPLYAIGAILTSVMANVFLIGTTYWLSVWVNSYSREEAVDVAFYLGIYIAIVVGGVLFDGFSFLVYANGSWVAGKRLHELCIRSVMYASLSWWKSVPVGRVVNRFSRDMNSLDNTLPRMLQAFLVLLVMLFARLSAISSIMPVFIIPGLFTCLIGVIAGEMYTRTVVTLRRLVSSSQSPVFSQFGDSLTGLAVIRARSGMARVFGDELAERLRKFSQASEANYNANRWVSVRVDCAAALVSLCAGVIAVNKAGTVAAGMVGFSLSNATGLSEAILWMVRTMNEVEVEMQSFYRVKEYVAIEPEEKTDDHRKDDADDASIHEEYVIPQNWPRSGSIEFVDTTIRYDPDGPDILKDINLKFKAGERVAVVGRTGSGKSTLVVSLLHFTNIVKGKILYDGVDITTIPRERLRQALTIIPQEATLFNGTVGSNLDPSGEIPASRLKTAIESCANIASFQFHRRAEDEPTQETEQQTEENEDALDSSNERTPLLQSGNQGENNGTVTAVAKAASGLSLDTPVKAQGENFSHGQRQVLSLCRALVRGSKLMLLDEATASMDYETDQGIQTILRDELFKDRHDNETESSNVTLQGEEGRTLITIAHRLRTIADYDKVVVLSAGRVVEVGSPLELYRSQGIFYEMVRHSGEGDELEQLLGE
ncbi:P-loop containing nucleoside triphosphate hydrolase protein [Xylariales sp. PMI_506]|nr:P-loop containing nucleoside triphosphate hydrolase protein [Xylariales sp. PMI_506]